MTPFPLRVLRAALLHAETYEEVEADRSSIRQALVVVIAASVAFGLARWIEMAGVEITPVIRGQDPKPYQITFLVEPRRQ